MPLPVPQLDDRRFDDLVAELLARIPAHTPEWTNPRVGDPGRTLIELFAFLGDTLLYRANQVPERQRRVFLNLLGLGLKAGAPGARPAGAAPARRSAATRSTCARAHASSAPCPSRRCRRCRSRR